jgi:hypothetical protein
VSDTHNAYSSGTYTVPVSGLYDVSAMAQFSATYTLNQNANISIFVDGTEKYTGVTQLQGAASSIFPRVDAKSIPLNAGQLVTVRVLSQGTSPTVSVSSVVNSFSITRVSGPSAIAASEKIFVEYSTSSGQSVTGAAFTKVNYNTKLRDTHGALSSGSFTAPRADFYEVEASCAPSAQAASSQVQFSIFKNNVEYRRVSRNRNTAASADDQPIAGASSLYLLAGDVIDLRVFVSTTQNLTTADVDNWLTIKSHGGV